MAAVSAPPRGLYRTPTHDYYWNGQGPFPGVTGALRIIDKPALATWAKQETARAALRNLPALAEMVKVGADDEAVKWLAKLPGYERDTAGKLGSRVHTLVEAESRGLVTEADETERPFLEAYRAFLKEYQPRFIVQEAGVISLTYEYGGTFDAIMQIGGLTYLVDYKTSKGVYTETALQLAAYRDAEFIGLPDDPTPYAIPPIDRCAVLHLRPEQYPGKGYALLEYRVGAAEFDAFLHALRLTQWAAAAKPVGEPVPTSWVKRR